jgi:choline dehydrogenase-like flavoprotein
LFVDKTHPKSATGVEFHKNGTTFKVNATKEVILSADAIASSQLLMLSEIGVKSHLKSLGIQVIEDLPVGHNFHDGFQVWFSFRPNFGSNKGVKNLLIVEKMYEFYTSGTGPSLL